MRDLRRPFALILSLSSLLFVACGSSKRASPDAPRDTGGGGGDTGGSDTGGSTDATDAAASTDAPADTSATDAPVTTATLFLAHAINNTIYRYSISPGQDPVLNATMPAMGPEGMTLSPTGELFAASADGSILRFTTPLATPTANGKIDGLDISEPEELTFVDGELWVPSTDYHSCTTTASKITRVAFDGAGVASAAGTLTAPGIVTASRGVLWDAGRRTLYLTQCDTVNVIQPYHVANDRTLTAVTPSTGGDIRNPHGMVLAPWGELLVSNAGPGQVLRFTVAADGALTANGVISGNGLNFPIGLAVAPWGELIVVNQGNGSLSRFTFDESDGGRAPTPRGVYFTGLDSSASSHALGWLLLVPASSTAAPVDAAVDRPPADAGTD